MLVFYFFGDVLMRAQAVHDRLSAHNYRNTRTRDVVIAFLAEQRYLITVEMISDALSVDPVTVYRVMDVLEQLGIVHKIQSDASYVTVPQSLRDEASRAILIDSHTETIHIRPHISWWDDFIATRTVVELRGKRDKKNSTQEQKTQSSGHRDAAHHKKKTLPTDNHTNTLNQHDALQPSKKTSIPTPDKTDDNFSNQNLPASNTDQSQDTIFDEGHIDRLHRF